LRLRCLEVVKIAGKRREGALQSPNIFLTAAMRRQIWSGGMGRSHQFGAFTLDLERLCLHGPAGQAALRPKSFEVLRYLVAHAGRVVTKDEVISAVWPGVAVTDESLTRCVSDVRRALGDQDQQIIKTVPRRGYLFELAVSSDDGQRTGSRDANGALQVPRLQAVSNVPIRVPQHFMGRDAALAGIAAAFGGGDGGLAVSIVALHGLRGVGKSTLAAACAERHCRDGGSAWWIRAHEEASLRADLVGLGIRLGWVGKDEKEEPALGAVMERLRHDGDGLLLIYDNAAGADALAPWLPRGGAARVIITANDHVWRRIATPIPIDVWPAGTGADFLIARTGRSPDRAVAEALSRALGGLPLAHEQAGAYCERLGVSLTAYLKRFEDNPSRYLDDMCHAPAGYGGGTVMKTFALAIDEAAQLHPAAEPLIVNAAMLAPDPIPLFLFAEARDSFDEPLRTALATGDLHEAVAALRAFALVAFETAADERDPSITADAVRLHRLVGEVAARRAGGRAAQLRQAIATALAVVYPEDGYRNLASWPRCALLTPHVLSICRTGMADSAADTQCAELLDRAGRYFSGRAAYKDARSLLERALAIRKTVLGADHPATAESLHSLAFLFREIGDLAGARATSERALAIRENMLGPDHPDTAQSLNLLAYLLQDRGDFAGARRLYERALAICENVHGPDHPETAESVFNLAVLHQAEGDLAGARVLHERALAIYEKMLGPDHPDVALSLFNLAVLHQVQGDPAGARLLHERALTIREDAHGAGHTYRARNLSDLAVLLQGHGDLPGARPLYQRALAIRENALGPKHPDTAQSLCDMAFLLEAQGDLAGTRPLYERALAIFEGVFGTDHPATANTLSNLARVMGRAGDADHAETLFKRAIAIGEKVLGWKHPLPQRFCSRYARYLLDTGRAAEALRLAEAAIAIQEAASGATDHWTRESAHIAADALVALGRGPEAAALRKRHDIAG
jgi:DNA-binding winged helix-turn-helix (wHTH) protein/tetratricopeptide (TPR) repeat protein